MNKKWEKILLDYDNHCKRIAKAGTIDINETPSQKSKRIKDLEKDYTKWFEYYFKHYAKCKCAWFHSAFAKLIIKHSFIRIVLEWFRSAAKSVHMNVSIPLFLYLVLDEMKFMLLVGETEPKSKRLIGDIQAELQHNSRLINDYGKKMKFGDWSTGEFSTVDDVKFLSIGFGQSPRGARDGAERPDYIVVDDIDNKKHVNNSRLMQEGEDWIFEDLMKCFDQSDKARQRFVFGNNNFHRNSILNRVKTKFIEAAKKAKRDKKPVQHHVITVKAVKDIATFEPEWPEKNSAEYWQNQYNENWIAFMRENMHYHIQVGKIFKHEMMQYKPVAKLDAYNALVLYGDLSYKAQADFKALILCGKIGREVHIIHTYVRQASRADAAIWLYDLYEDKKLHKYNITYKIEGLFAMDEFINDFDEEGDERGYHIPVVPDKRPKDNKYDRIESIVGYFQRRNVYYNIAEKESLDQKELIDQFLAFEKGSLAHDDGPDCIHGAIDELNRAAYVQAFEPRITKIHTTNNRY